MILGFSEKFMYIKRNIEEAIVQASKKYPVVMVCGQRQVGKSTMLNHIKENNRRYVSFDDRQAKRLAETDSTLFLETYVALIVKPGLVICLCDEIVPINKNCYLIPVSLI